MTDIHIMLSDPEALARYRLLVETIRLLEGELTAEAHTLLEQRAAELGVHRLDMEQIDVELHELPSVQAAIAMYTARRRRAQHDHEEIIAERVANRQLQSALTEQLTALRQEQSEALAAQAEQLQAEREQREALAAQLEQLRQQLAVLEQELRSQDTVAQSAPEAATLAETPGTSPAVSASANETAPALTVVVVTEPPADATDRTAEAPEPPVLSDGSPLVWIPAGDFTLGSEEGDDEQPARSIFLDGYFIYKYPVSVRQYKQFCMATGRRLPDLPYNNYTYRYVFPDFDPNWSREDHPIVLVNWNDATAYCEWLSQESGVRVSLPTEAQWEKAARGTDGRRFPWGDTFESSRLWCSVETPRNVTAAVTQREAMNSSPYGVLNMAGNALDWCTDWYSETYYEVAPPRNPPGPGWGTRRVVRGGCWCDTEETKFRCTYRAARQPEETYIGLGFRCVVHVDTL